MTRRIYLDYASTTPMDPSVKRVMDPYFAAQFGNPSALYKEALVAKEAVRSSRQSIARHLNIRPEEVVFTGSGTEADNLALLGVFNSFKHYFTEERGFKKGMVPHVVTSNIEHPGILEMCRYIEKNGGEVTYVPVEENGIVDSKKVVAAVRPNTILVSVMLANNEIGTIQPLRDISRLLAEYRKSISTNQLFPYLHTDASQAANYLDLSFQKLGVDLMTLDGSKIYGPKGVGILAVRKHVSISPILFGGGQERGLRSGTENVPGIVGFTKALEIAQSLREDEVERLEKLQEYFIENLVEQFPEIVLNGDRKQRLPNNINICIPNTDAEFLVIKLDNAGVAASAASACLNLSEKSESYVIEALYSGKNNEREQLKNCSSSSLRFTLGRYTTLKEIRLTLKILTAIITTQ